MPLLLPAQSLLAQLLIFPGDNDLNRRLSSTFSVHEEEYVKGSTPLLIATEMNYKNLAGFLVRAQCNVDAQNDIGETALYIAARRGFHEIIDLLLKANANRELCTVEDNQTPLMIAKAQGYTESIKLLGSNTSNSQQKRKVDEPAVQPRKNPWSPQDPDARPASGAPAPGC